MAFYIKVRVEVADYLKLTTERNRTKDGCVLLWQADVARFPGDTIFERASYAGGVALTAAVRQGGDRRDGLSRRSVPARMAAAGRGRNGRTHGRTRRRIPGWR